MVLRVFFISGTGRRDIRKRQIHVFAVLSSWKYEFQAIDVADPDNEKEREFVIENGKKMDDGKMMLPQIFREEECCGDYLEFLQAIEHEKLQLFLKQITQEEFDALEKTKAGETEEVKAEGEEETERDRRWRRRREERGWRRRRRREERGWRRRRRRRESSGWWRRNQRRRGRNNERWVIAIDLYRWISFLGHL